MGRPVNHLANDQRGPIRRLAFEGPIAQAPSGEVLVMDNLRKHHDPRVALACEARGVRLLYQPPHSPDFNSIEPAWAYTSSSFAGTHPAATSVAWHVVPAFTSPRAAAVSGSPTLAMELDSGDPWG